MVYLEEIIMLEATLEEQLQNLARVFDHLIKAGLSSDPVTALLPSASVSDPDKPIVQRNPQRAG